MQRSTIAFALTLVTSSTLACQADDDGHDHDHDHESESETSEGHDEHGDGDGDAQLGPSYWQDVAPIYYASCVECHREGGVGPFTLDDYESAAAWAPASAIAVEQRVMPPWLVLDDGSCNSWQHSPVLDEQEIETILAWVEADTPEGTPRDDLERPELPGLDEGRSFTTPLFTPEPDGGLFAEHDDYRCFLLDPELEQDQFITGYEVQPGNEALVHHVLVTNIKPDVDVGGLSNLERIQELDAEDPDTLGWSCFGVAGEGVAFESIPVSWAPGQGAVEFPGGSGSRVAAGELLVVQVHYNMADPAVIGQSDSSTVKLRFADEVERPALIDLPDGLLATLGEGEPYAIPPGEPEHSYTWSFPVDWYLGWEGAEQIELHGFFPHMHDYGTSMSVRLLDQQGEELSCIGEVPRWDFAWQLQYFMEQPIVLESGMRIEVTCRYDTTGVQAPMWPGWGTNNEMCLTGLYMLPA